MKLNNPQQYHDTFGDIVVRNTDAGYYDRVYSIAQESQSAIGPVYVFLQKHPEYHKRTIGCQGRYTMSCSIEPSKQPGVVRFYTDVVIFLTNENDKNQHFVQEYVDFIKNSGNVFGEKISVHYLLRGDETNFKTIQKMFPFDIKRGTMDDYANAEKVCALCRINDILSVVPVQVPQQQWTIEQLRAAAAQLAAQRAAAQR